MTTRPQPTEPPKRMSLSRAMEMMLSRSSGDRSSVALSRNPAGHTLIDVTVRTGDSGDVLTVEDAERKAVEVYERLSQQFPSVNGHEAAEVELTRNAKGETQIKVSAKTGDAAPTLGKLADATREVYDKTRMRYPMESGLTAKPGSVK